MRPRRLASSVGPAGRRPGGARTAARGPVRPAAAAASADRGGQRVRGPLLPRRVAVVLGAVVVLLVAAGYAVLATSVLGVREVHVQGAQSVSAAQVRAALDVRDGFPMARVQLDAAASQVEQLAQVRSATVEREWPHGLRVTVTEREPVAVVRRGSGWAYVDSEGVAFAEAPAGATKAGSGHPVIRTRRGDLASLRSASAVVASLPPQVLLKVQRVDAKTADSVTLVLKAKRTVIWGSPDRSERKGRVVVVLLRSVPDGKVYDVSAPDAPTVE